MPSDHCIANMVLFFVRFLRRHLPTFATISFCLIHITSLRAQERVRTSAQPLPIQSFQRPPEEFFQLGPFHEELRGAVGVEYDDNVNLTNTDRISDLSFNQGLSLNTTWVISYLNKLVFNFGGQLIENFYGNGKTRVNFAVDPNSKIEFNFAIGDTTVIRLYDEFSFVQNPTTDPTATNTANLNSLSNTIGAAVDEDLGLALVSVLADYSYNNQSGTNSQGQANPTTTGTRETFRAGPTITFRLSPTILYGVDVIGTKSSGTSAANVNSLNAGPFIKGKLSDHFEFELAAGITLVHTQPEIPTDYYVSAALRYRLTPATQVLFSASHNLIFTVGTSLTEQNLFTLGIETGLTRYISFTLSPFVNYGDVLTSTTQTGASAVFNQGPYTQFGVTAGLAWKLRKRWSTALTYNFIRRESSSTFGTGVSGSNNYIQNTIAFSIGYAF